jgi:hypothetical protein
MFTFRRAFGLIVPILAIGLMGACSAGKKAPSNLDPEATGGSMGGAGGSTGGSTSMGTGGSFALTGGSNGTGGSIAGGSSGSAGMGTGGSDFQECAESKETGMPVPVDVYVMLDISGSMLDPAGGATSTTSKWDAVKSALSAFFNDAQSAGLSVAIQYFPLRVPGVPASCMTDADCGAGAPCLRDICKLNTTDALISCTTPGDMTECTNAIQRDDGPCVTELGASATTCHLSGKACTTATDCQTIASINNGPCTNMKCAVGGKACAADADCVNTSLGSCVDYGVCANDNTYSCGDTSTTTNPKGCGGTLGACIPATTYFCAHETQCDPNNYATPAVEFLTLPDTANALNGSIAAQMPAGDTPSRSALRGAIHHARDWAMAHAGHTVVVVLATDGLPTECTGGREISGESPTALDDTVAVATDGSSGTPSIETFVVGVFANSDTSAQSNLDRIAMAGGSDKAYLISSDGNVQQDFLNALAQIRAAHVGCEFEIPQPKPGSMLAYNQVNVYLTTTDPNMPTEFYYVAPDKCTGADDEWHYDIEPSSTATPTKIVACPKTCDRLKMTAGATVSLSLGCMLHIR